MFSAFQKKLTQLLGPLQLLGNLRIAATGTSNPIEVNSKSGGVLFKVNKSGTTEIASGIYSPTTDFSITAYSPSIKLMASWNGFWAIGSGESDRIIFLCDNRGMWLKPSYPIGWGSSSVDAMSTKDVWMNRESANTAGHWGKDYREDRWYAKYSSSTAYQRTSLKSYSETLSVTGASVSTTTLIIPKYSQLIGVTTRVMTALGTTNGTTGYLVGDGADADLWGAMTGTAIGTSSDARDYTAINALGPSSVDRTVTLTAAGGDFDGTGVIDVCAFYLRAEAD